MLQRVKLEKETGIPLYIQIMRHIDQMIEDGEWTEGSSLPTEDELCEAYDVSKITVREALKLLVRDGKIRRTAGKGTFVTKPKLEQKLDRFFSFTNWATQNGLEPSSRLLNVESVECGRYVARHLGLEEGDLVTRIERVRLGSGEPLMAEHIWVSEAVCPDIESEDLDAMPLNELIASRYDVRLVVATETIEAVVADEHTADLLNTEPEALILSVEHTAFTADNRPVYLTRSFYRGDRVKFAIRLGSQE